MEKIINLSSIVQRAKDGYYESESEIILDAKKAIIDVNEHKDMALNAFRKQSTCSHGECSKPYYQLQKRMIGYAYIFQKDCLECGKHFSISDDGGKYNERNPPEGYECAESRYYNNNI